jgi:hypothetical protein
MIKKKLIYLVGGIILLWPITSLAATFIVEEEGVQAVTNADIEDDLYIGGNNVSVSHNVAEDLFAGANMVNVNANVGQDLHAGGNIVRITGEVGDDLFAGGNTVIVNVSTVDDVFAGGQIIEITGDVIKGSVYAGGQNVNIKGDIKGSVRIGAETINIKSGTTIAGDLITTGNNEPNIESGVQITGEQRHSLVAEKKAKGAWGERNLLMEWVLGVLVWFVVALTVSYLIPGTTKEVVDTVLTKGGKSLGIGFAWMALFIPTIIMLIITMVGWPLAIMLGVFTPGNIMLAITLSGVIVGVWAMKKLGKEESKITWQHILLGVVIIRTVSMVPIIGWLIGLAVMLMSFGAIGIVLWERLRTEKTTVVEPAEIK